MINISLVICHRQNSEERKENLFYQLKYYDRTFNEIMRVQPNLKFDIWIIEQDTHTRIDKLQQQVKLSIPFITQFCYSDKEFNRSWGMNVGVNLSHADICLCSDNDIILKKETILKSLQTLISGKDKFNFPYEVLWCYENFIDLNPEQTKIWKKTGQLDFPNQVCRYGRPSSQINKVGGCYFVKRNFHLSIGGMDEKMRGWGCEDDEYYYRISRVLESQKRDWNPRLNHNIYHLFHERVNLEAIRIDPLYKKNSEIMNATCTMPFNELLCHIEEMKKDLGNPYKYKKA